MKKVVLLFFFQLLLKFKYHIYLYFWKQHKNSLSGCIEIPSNVFYKKAIQTKRSGCRCVIIGRVFNNSNSRIKK